MIYLQALFSPTLSANSILHHNLELTKLVFNSISKGLDIHYGFHICLDLLLCVMFHR